MNNLNKDFFGKLGIKLNDASNQWILQSNSKTNSFFDWLQDEIDDKNILSLTEAKEYDEIKSQKGVISKNEIEKQYEQIKLEYPGVFDSFEHDLMVLQEEIPFLKNVLEKKCNILDGLNSFENSQLLVDSKLKLFLETRLQESEELMKYSVKWAVDLQRLKEENQQLFKKLQLSFKSCLYIHQMPFYVCQNNIDQYISKLEAHLNRNQVLTDLRMTETNYDLKLGQLQKAKNLLVESRAEEMETELRSYAMENVVSKINSNTRISMDTSQFREITSEYECSNEHLTLLFEQIKQEYLLLLDQIALAEIELLSAKNVEYKYNRAKHRYKNINLLLPLLRKMVSIVEVIWFGLCFDYEKFNKAINSVEIINMYDISQRLDSMTRLVNTSQIPKNIKDGQEKIYESLKSLITTDDAPHLNEIWHAYQQFNNNVEEQLLLLRDENISVQKQMANFSSCESSLKTLVYGGPTAQPKLFDPRFEYQLQKTIERNVFIESKIKKLRTDFKENILEKMAQDKYYRYFKNLWVWFLTEPKKVLHAIEEVKTTSTKHSSVHLSGLRRK